MDVEHWWNDTRKISHLGAILFRHTFFTWTNHGLNPVLWDDTLVTNCLSHSTSENTVRCCYLHITTLQRASDFKKLQIIVLAPNFLMMAENGCRLGGKCYLSRQGRRESLTSRDASSPSSAVYSAPFNLNLLSLRSKSLQISARFQGVISQKKNANF